MNPAELGGLFLKIIDGLHTSLMHLAGMNPVAGVVGAKLHAVGQDIQVLREALNPVADEVEEVTDAAEEAVDLVIPPKLKSPAAAAAAAAAIQAEVSAKG